jgi:MFS family permease
MPTKPAARGRDSDSQRVRWLLVVVMIDLSAVALVVPLIPVKMRELGVRPELIGLIGSIYSGSQIVGGLVLGTLSDRISRSHYTGQARSFSTFIACHPWGFPI